MPSTWTDSLDKKLLLEFIRVNDVKTKSWNKVAEAMGPDFTVPACQQRFAKIRASEGYGTAQDYNSSIGVDSEAQGSQSKTPTSTPRKKGTPGKRKGKADDDDGDDGASPKKKKATPKKKGVQGKGSADANRSGNGKTSGDETEGDVEMEEQQTVKADKKAEKSE